MRVLWEVHVCEGPVGGQRLYGSCRRSTFVRVLWEVNVCEGPVGGTRL